jgi:antirestriction protein ArdC
VKKLGGTVKQGEKASPVVFWKFFKTEDKTTKKEKTIPMLRNFQAFNIEQCDIPEKELVKLAKRLDKLAGQKVVKTDKTENEKIEVCEATIRAYLDGQALQVQDKASAFYSPSHDYIGMPQLDTFKTSEHYYATLFHEAVHSTGHKNRLNRKDLTDEKNTFGTVGYAREELTAELGASFLCGIVGIDTQPVTENRDAYIKNWLRKLRNDNKCIIVASGKAGKASDYILGEQQEGDTEYTPKK